MKKISIIVPAYNEEEVIEMFYDKTIEVLKRLENEYIYELIFIDDGSKDETLNKLKNLRKRDSKINIISFSRNFGKEAGILAGLQNTTGDFIVIMDADLQNDPNMIKKMLNYINEGYDTVTTIRNKKGESKIKSFLSNIFYKIIDSEKNIELKQGSQDFRMMTKQVKDAILTLNEYNRFSKGIFSWVGFKVKYIETENHKRAAGKTKWSYKALMSYALDGITSFSVKPLKIATIVGTIISILALILAIEIVLQTIIQGKEVPGYASTIISVLFIGGIQLISIGILSTYVGKIYLEIKNRPKYIYQVPLGFVPGVYIIKEKYIGENNERDSK